MNIFFHRSFCELRKPVARVYILYLNLFGLATTAPLSPTIAPLSVIFEPVIFELGIIKHSRFLSYAIENRRGLTNIELYFLSHAIKLSHWYNVNKVFYTPEAKLRRVCISYITKRS